MTSQYLRDEQRIYQSRGKITKSKKKKKREKEPFTRQITKYSLSSDLLDYRLDRVDREYEPVVSRTPSFSSRKDEKRRFQSGLLAPAKDDKHRPTRGGLGQHAGFKAGRLIALPYTFILGDFDPSLVSLELLREPTSSDYGSIQSGFVSSLTLQATTDRLPTAFVLRFALLFFGDLARVQSTLRTRHPRHQEDDRARIRSVSRWPVARMDLYVRDLMDNSDCKCSR